MPMKTAELTGAALDYWVAKAEGVADGLVEKDGRMCRVEEWSPEKMAWRDDLAAWKMWMDYAPSQRWDEGGPLIEREGIAIYRTADGWSAVMPGGFAYPGDLGYIDVSVMDDGVSGPTPLVAAMRAFVLAKLGEEVPEVPTGNTGA